MALGADLYDCPPLQKQVCDDPDDDKFLACALASNSPLVISGDKLLLKVGEYRGVRGVKPRDFVHQYL
jgi:predicted nucleic acid-binding protein